MIKDMDPTIKFLQENIQPYTDWYMDPAPLTLSHYRLKPGVAAMSRASSSSPTNPTALMTGLRSSDAMVWANLDALYSLSPAAIDPVSTSYRNYHESIVSIISIEAPGAAEYFLWRNPRWECFLVGGGGVGGDTISQWTYLEDVTRLQVLTSHQQPDETVLREVINQINITVPLAVAGIPHPTEAQVAWELLIGVFLMVPDGDLVIRFAADQSELIPIFGMASALFKRATIVAPIVRSAETDRYFVGSGFRANLDIQGIANILIPVLSRQQSFVQSVNPQWYAYWQRRLGEPVTLPPGYWYIQQLYGWWAMLSPRWRSIVPV